jgi:membrane protein required for colicin V production
MNYIDIFIIAIFAWFGYKGFRKGLVFELISILALGLGVYGGLKFSDVTAEYLTKYIDSEYLNIASFTVTFLVILLLVFMAGKVVEKVINLVALKLVNKVLGAVFAVLKMGIILGVIITILESKCAVAIGRGPSGKWALQIVHCLILCSKSSIINKNQINIKE